MFQTSSFANTPDVDNVMVPYLEVCKWPVIDGCGLFGFQEYFCTLGNRRGIPRFGLLVLRPAQALNDIDGDRVVYIMTARGSGREL